MKVETMFEVIEKEGLGRVLRCKICYYKHKKEFIVVSVRDAEGHLEYHKRLWLLLQSKSQVKTEDYEDKNTGEEDYNILHYIKGKA